MVLLSAWSGRPEEALKFTVEAKQASHLWTKMASHNIDMRFDGVDSPIAWAAHSHGCSIVEKAEEAIASSADAICHLVSRNCSNEVCEVADQMGLGGKFLKGLNVPTHPAPSLSPASTVKVLSCAPCHFDNEWQYNQGELQLKQHSASLQPNVLLTNALDLGHAALLSQIHRGISDKTEAEAFRRDMATAAWHLEVPPPAHLIRTLSNFNTGMPSLLFQELIVSTSQIIPKNATELEVLEAGSRQNNPVINPNI